MGYCKPFKAPKAWKELCTWVNFGGVHPSAEVWINGVKLGENQAPFVPFGFDITKLIQFDKENFIVARVHEQARQMGFSFNWCGNWSGLYRGVELTATGICFLDQFRIYPDVDSRKIKFKVAIGGFEAFGKPLNLLVSARAMGHNPSEVSAKIQVTGAEAEFEIPAPAPRLWSPDSPNLYQVDAALTYNGQIMDALSERSGLSSFPLRGISFSSMMSLIIYAELETLMSARKQYLPIRIGTAGERSLRPCALMVTTRCAVSHSFRRLNTLM